MGSWWSQEPEQILCSRCHEVEPVAQGDGVCIECHIEDGYEEHVKWYPDRYGYDIFKD